MRAPRVVGSALAAARRIVAADSSAASAVREAESWTTYEQPATVCRGLPLTSYWRALQPIWCSVFPRTRSALVRPAAVRFRCRCSVDRVSGMLRSLGAAEVDSIVAEQGAVTVTCEFCHKPWRSMR